MVFVWEWNTQAIIITNLRKNYVNAHIVIVKAVSNLIAYINISVSVLESELSILSYIYVWQLIFI